MSRGGGTSREVQTRAEVVGAPEKKTTENVFLMTKLKQRDQLVRK